MIFRDYNPEDYQELVHLWDELEMHTAERGDTPGIIDQCNRMGGKLILMEDPDKHKIIGSSWITFDGRRMFLHHFGIRKAYQNHGYGKALAKETLKFIKSAGYQVKLEVHTDNLTAKHLYEEMGFFTFENYDIYMIRDLESIKV